MTPILSKISETKEFIIIIVATSVTLPSRPLVLINIPIGIEVPAKLVSIVTDQATFVFSILHPHMNHIIADNLIMFFATVHKSTSTSDLKF